ncbi:MAG: hypothetical protein ACUVWN_16680 [bacterium]
MSIEGESIRKLKEQHSLNIITARNNALNDGGISKIKYEGFAQGFNPDNIRNSFRITFVSKNGNSWSVESY